MKKIETEQVARDVIKVKTPVILEQTSITRRCFHGSLVRVDGKWELRGCITAERKGQNGSWHEEDGAKLSQLKSGEIRKLNLGREQVRNLFSGLGALIKAGEEHGVELDLPDLIVARRENIVEVSADRRAVIEQLIQNDYSSEFWDHLRELRPDITTQLADAELLRRRKSAVAVFEEELENQLWDEGDWEKFFQANQWIFGLGLRFQFLSVLHNQANYGGANFTRKGEQKGEFLMNTEGEEKFTVLVEIKRPETRFFQDGQYRNGVPKINPEFMNAISQVQVNTHTWEMEGSKREHDLELLSEENIRTISPRSILVCGNTSELSDSTRRKAFELFRRRLSLPEIVTFDELLARARFIVRESVV
jgi:antiviral defense system Shedu protein SduA